VAEIQRRVCDAAASVLVQGDATPLEPSTSLWDLGMNSVLAVSLASALESEFGCSLPASIAFDYGTLKDLAGFIHSKYFASAAADAAAAVSAASTVVRRISTPNRRRHSRKVSRVPSIVYLEAPEPEPPTAREVVFSVLAQLLPQEFQPSRARTISLATSSNAF
jgi:acyl carrier protein